MEIHRQHPKRYQLVHVATGPIALRMVDKRLRTEMTNDKGEKFFVVLGMDELDHINDFVARENASE